MNAQTEHDTGLNTDFFVGVRNAVIAVVVLLALFSGTAYVGDCHGYNRGLEYKAAHPEISVKWVDHPYTPPELRDSLEAALQFQRLYLAESGRSKKLAAARDFYQTMYHLTAAAVDSLSSDSTRANSTAPAAIAGVKATVDTTIKGVGVTANYYFPPLNTFVFDIRPPTQHYEVPETTTTSVALKTESSDWGKPLKWGVFGVAVGIVLDRVLK